MYKSAAVLAFAAVAAALPTASSDATCNAAAGTKYEATFDDLSELLDVVALEAVGPYDGLDYEGIDLVQLGLGGTIVTGVVPQSSPNAGAYGLTTDLLSGAPKITTQYSGSVTDVFDFDSFYYGCVAGTVEAIASAPVQCTVTVTGYKASQQVAQQKFDFNVGLLELKADMVEAKLSEDFKGIDTATFSSTYDVSALGATLLDSLTYTTYNADDKDCQSSGNGNGSGWEKW